MGCGEEKKKKKNPCRYRASILLGKDLLNKISKQHGMSDGDKCKGDKRKAVKGHTGSWWTVLLDLVTRKNLTENVTFEQRPEGGKAAENVVIWEKSIAKHREQQVQRSCGGSTTCSWKSPCD